MLELVNPQSHNSENDPVIILGEDNYSYAGLILQNLKRAGIKNKIVHFSNGEKILNFLFRKGTQPHRQEGVPYIAILNVRLPDIDGIEILRKIKGDNILKSIPAFMMSSKDDAGMIELCTVMGCSQFMVFPKDYDRLKESIAQLGYHLIEEVIPAQKNKSSRQAM